MANAWDAIGQPVQSPGLVTPDLQNSLGLGDSEDDDATTRFTKHLQAGMYANSQQGRELTSDLAKKRMEAQIQLQLREQEMQLAQKYPEYTHIITNPVTGAVTAMSKFGGTKEISGAIPGMQDMNTAKIGAETAKYNAEADPETIAAEKKKTLLAPELAQSTIDYNNGMKAQLAAARINKLNTGPQAKPLSPENAQKLATQQILGTSTVDMYSPNVMAWKKAHPGENIMDTINQKAQDLQNTSRSQKGLAAPQPTSAAGVAPDMSGLMDFGDDDQ